MRLIIGLLALMPLFAEAQTAYVTDNLRLGLHEAEDTSGRAFRMLDSGQAMDILSQDRNYANVRLPDGTEGWVKVNYLVTDKPAKLIVAETMAERDALVAELADVKQAFAGPAATIEALQAESDALGAQLADANSQIEELQRENESYLGLKDQYKGSLPLSWVAVALCVFLISGFLVGLWWVDRRSRQRHGGIRIY